MEVGVGPGDFVFDGDPAPLPKKQRSPLIFGPCLLFSNGWMDQDVTWYKLNGGLDPSDIVLRGDLAPLLKKGQSPPIFGLCLLWPNGCIYQDKLHVEVSALATLC